MAYAPARARDAALVIGAGRPMWPRSFIASYYSDDFEFCQSIVSHSDKIYLIIRMTSAAAMALSVGCDGAAASLRSAAIQAIAGRRREVQEPAASRGPSIRVPLASLGVLAMTELRPLAQQRTL